MGSEVCFSSSNWLGTILSHFFWHWYPWGPSSMSIWSTVSSLSTSIFWNLSSGAQEPSVDRDFPGEVAEYRSLCLFAELKSCVRKCLQMNLFPRDVLQGFLWFLGIEVAARRSRSRQEEVLVYVFDFNLFDYVCAQSFSRVWLFATPWAVSHQSLPSMKFSRQEYWNG